MALVANGCADLTNGVDEFHPEHPLGRGELDLTRKVVDVLDQRSQNHASTLGGLGAHGVDNAGSEVGVELARHCDVMVYVVKRNAQVIMVVEDSSGESWGGQAQLNNQRKERIPNERQIFSAGQGSTAR